MLSVWSVIITVLPMSPAAGVYVKAKGDVNDKVGVRVPEPFSDRLTLVALPPKVLPLIVIGLVPQVVPVVLVNEMTGHCPFPSIEINKIKLSKRRTRDISCVNKFISYNNIVP
jgi:hypothetical protein